MGLIRHDDSESKWAERIEKIAAAAHGSKAVEALKGSGKGK